MFSMKTLAFQYRNFKQRSTGNDFITQARGPEADRQTNRQILVDGPTDARPAKTAAGRNPRTLSWPPKQLCKQEPLGHRCSRRDCSTWPADHPARPP